MNLRGGEDLTWEKEDGDIDRGEQESETHKKGETEREKGKLQCKRENPFIQINTQTAQQRQQGITTLKNNNRAR